MLDPLFTMAAQAAAHHVGISPGVVFGRRRTGPAIQARHLAMALVLDITELSLEQVAAGFDQRPHAALYAKRKVAERRLSDPDFAALFADMRSALVLASVGIKAVEMLRHKLLQRVAASPEALVEICATLGMSTAELEAAPWPAN